MSLPELKLTLHFLTTEPVAAARKLELLEPDQAAAIVKEASLSCAKGVLTTMLPSASARLFVYFTDAQCLKLVESMNMADLAAILRYMDKQEQRELLNLLSLRKQTLCKMLISYPEYALGSIVETDILVVDSHMQVDEVLLRLKKKTFSYLQSLYVVNDRRQLEGQIFIGQLFHSSGTTPVSNLAQQVSVTLNASMDMLSAFEMDVWQAHDVIVVVNRNQEFIGVVHANRLRHFISHKNIHEKSNKSVSADLLDAYGETIISMVDLMNPVDH